MLTKKMQSKARLLDTITVKGSARPLNIYTIDVNLKVFENEKNKGNHFDIEDKESKKSRVFQKIRRDKWREWIFDTQRNENLNF